jgi:hypothetical protein
MTALPPWRVALAALLVAAALAGAATAIVWQTSSPPAAPSPPEPEPDPPALRANPSLSAAPRPPASSSAPAEPALVAEVRSLVAAGQIGKARSRANAYFELFPDGPSTAELQRLTGAHPRR